MNTERKIRVLVVEDSAVVRELLEYIIAADPRLEVVAAVETAEEALRILDRAAPDVISMDIRLPGMNGFEATQRIMASRPTPIVVVSASVESEELNITMNNALRAGALAVVEKPVGITRQDYQQVAARLCTQLVIMSEVRVVKQRNDRGFQLGAGTSSDRIRRVSAQPGPRPHTPFRLLGVVASTGGPGALVQLFEGLGAAFPLPILLVQHITASFLHGFVAWLDSVCPFSVVIAADGDIPAPGRVYVPPPDHHLCFDAGVLRTNVGPLVALQRPSGTVLLQSMARSLGAQAIGVILTGMGEDGAAGLLELREAGGFTIAEDETTAVVYGMPAAAVRLGAACETLPLDAIASRIAKICLE